MYTPPMPNPADRSGRTRRAGPAAPARFLLVFALGIAIFYALMSIPPIQRTVFPAYLRASAEAAALALRGIGRPASARDAIVTTPGSQLRVARGCDGIEPMAFFACALIALPRAAPRRTLAAIALGLAGLWAVNVLRIVTLALAQAELGEPSFLRIHDAWQPVFVTIVVAAWFIAATWALATRQVPASA